MSQIYVTKRDGRREPLDLEKLHRVVFWGCEGITGVSPSEVEIRSSLQFYDGIKTTDVQEMLIKSAADLISEESPNYQNVAGRLINYHLRKEVYGQYEPWHIKKIVQQNVQMGFYDAQLVSAYSDEEWDRINSMIRHERDNDMAYVGMEQMRGKYLVQNRVTQQIYETPQVCYILIAATLFQNYPAETRLHWVKEYYEAISTHLISLPTPVMAGVRTNQRQFSSCVLVETGDSLDSINATTSAIVRYVSQKAGIGIGGGRIRALKSPIRNGDAYHTGVIPFYKLFQSAVKSCSQGGVRNGSATLYYPIWHLEVEDLLVLKNNKGTEDNRIRQMDYGVQFNKVMYERLLSGGNITLFSPSDVPGLYDAFFADTEEFRRLYTQAEANPAVRKKTVKASELFSQFAQERKDTGRIYLQNVDHANSHSPFDPAVAPIKQSNLCAEIDLPTKPLIDVNDSNGEIALCTLSAINWGMIHNPEDFAKPCELAVRGLDALLSCQHYPVPAAKRSTDLYRPLGVGIVNFAYWLAKHGYTYTNSSCLPAVDEYMEAMSYYLIKTSVELAQEQGPCEGWQNLRYAKGIVPVDTRKSEVDELVPYVERMPWAELRARAATVGIRNATLMAIMPSETSSQVGNSTNGIEPVRSLISVKQSKHGVLKQVVPEFRKLKNKYELLWNQASPEGYLKICAVLQKWVDQGISVNTSYNPAFYPDEKIPMSELLKHILMFYRYGGKQLYYNNTHDGQGEINVEKITEPASECESCVI
jgi:ribonucleoside-diphosphate reductase alpha chain